MDRPGGRRTDFLGLLGAIFVGDCFDGTLLANTEGQVNLFTLD